MILRISLLLGLLLRRSGLLILHHWWSLILLYCLIGIEVVRCTYLWRIDCLRLTVYEGWLLLGYYLLLNKNLIVLISLLVLDFLLVICDAPLTINDVLELIESRWQLLNQEESSVWFLLHGNT